MNKTLVAIFGIALIVLVIAGIFLWYVPAWLFNSLLLATAGGFVLLILGGVAALWSWAGRLGLIYPDENGNYPIKMVWRFVIGWKQFGIEVLPVNLNLTGSTSYREWATWQVTNNRRASQPKDLLEGAEAQTQLMLVNGPGQSLVIDAVAQDF